MISRHQKIGVVHSVNDFRIGVTEYMSQNQKGNVIGYGLSYHVQKFLLLFVDSIMNALLLFIRVGVAVSFLRSFVRVFSQLPTKNHGITIVIVSFPYILHFPTNIEYVALGAVHVNFC